MDDKQADRPKPPVEGPAVDDEDAQNEKRHRSGTAGLVTTPGGVLPFDFTGVDTEWLSTLVRPANFEQIASIASLASGAAEFNSNTWSSDRLNPPP